MSLPFKTTIVYHLVQTKSFPVEWIATRFFFFFFFLHFPVSNAELSAFHPLVSSDMYLRPAFRKLYGYVPENNK